MNPSKRSVPPAERYFFKNWSRPLAGIDFWWGKMWTGKEKPETEVEYKPEVGYRNKLHFAEHHFYFIIYFFFPSDSFETSDSRRELSQSNWILVFSFWLRTPEKTGKMRKTKSSIFVTSRKCQKQMEMEKEKFCFYMFHQNLERISFLFRGERETRETSEEVVLWT